MADFSEGNRFSFPDLLIEDSKKDAQYHKKFVQAVMSNNINANFDLTYASMNENYTFFQGDQTGDEFRFLQESEDGEVLPAQWINYNKISSRVELLLGELQRRGYQITATAINKEAKSRKLSKREKDRVNLWLQPYRKGLQKKSGLNFTPPGQEFGSEPEIDDFYENDYKEQNEIVMQYALRYIAKKHDWGYQRLALFRDILIAGRAAVICEMKDGLPYMRRIDPRNLVFDPTAQDDFLSDATYYGELRYMAMPDAAAKYNLNLEELRSVWDSYKQFQTNQYTSGQFKEFKTIHGSNLRYFHNDSDKLRVLVATAYWQDTKTINHKIKEDKHGGRHVEEVTENATSNRVTKNKLSIWRTATLIGGTLLAEWGEMKNHIRHNSALAETFSPIKVVIPNYINGKSISKVDQLKGLQKLKDITMYNIQLAMTRAGAKGFFYDIAQLPDTWTLEDVVRYTKTHGIIAFDSRIDGLPAGYNQFQEVDQTLSNSVSQYILISNMIDSEMDAISGINDARQGNIQGSSQAVGVTQSAIMQSNLATELYFTEFQQFSSHIYNYLSGLAKIGISKSDKLDGAIGESGVNFIKENSGLNFDDFATFIDDVPPLVDNVNMYHTTLMAALQSNAITFKQYSVLVREKDPLVGLKRFERMVTIEEAKAAKQQAQQQQMMMQAQQAQQQAEQGGKMALGKQKGDYSIEQQKLENVGEMNEEMVKGKYGMAGKKIDFTKDLMLQKISKQIDDIKNGTEKKQTKKESSR